MAFPFWGFAQDTETVKFDTYIEQLNAQCPDELSDGWSISKVEIADNDTVILEIRTPASLTGFISLLVVDNEKGRQLWGNHLKEYGDDWKQFLGRLKQEGRPLRLGIRPRGSRESHFLTYRPEDIGIILAND